LSKSSVEKAILFTGNRPQETLILLAESSNEVVLDSACTTVAGETSTNCYWDSLDPAVREKVVEQPSDTKFKFAGGTVFQSKRIVKFPCVIAGTECEM